MAGEVLRKNFICHCSLQQTSLLIRSLRIHTGIWTVSLGVDRIMSSVPRPPRATPTFAFLSTPFIFLFFLQPRYKGTRMATLEGAFGAISPSSGRRAHCELPPPCSHPGGPPSRDRLPSITCLSSLSLHFFVLGSFMHWLHTPHPKHAIDFRPHSLYALIGRRLLNVERKKKNQYNAK